MNAVAQARIPCRVAVCVYGIAWSCSALDCRVARLLGYAVGQQHACAAGFATDLDTLAVQRAQAVAIRLSVEYAARERQAEAAAPAESERLSALIEDLYPLSRAGAGAGALEYRFVEVDLANLAREVMGNHGGSRTEAGSRLRRRPCAGAG